MRFLVDECTGPAVAHGLRQQEYESSQCMKKHVV